MGKRLALFNAALIIILLLAAVMGIMPVKAEDPLPPENLTTGIEPPGYKVPGLDSGLARLVKGLETERTAAVAQQLNLDFKDDKVRVILEAKPGKAVEAAALAISLGADVETTYEDLVQAMVPVAALSELAGSDIISLVRRPYSSMPSAISQGVGLINATAWQAAGYTGAGTKVGILDLGFSGYAALLGTDLPATVTTWWAPSRGGPGTEVHGTACAEVVYDVAPGAQFYLANYNTDVEYANAVNWLISQGVNVISHSVSNYYGPGDGTGYSCTKVNDARVAGITWAQSAGNYAQTHWAGTFSGDIYDYNIFRAPAANINRFYTTAGSVVGAFLRWNDTWGASGNDYDLYLCRWNGATWVIVAASQNWQTGTQNPFEWINYSVPTSGTYGLVIHKYAAIGNASMDLMTWRNALEYAVASGSLSIPADSPNAITVGAVNWDTPTVITTYSSQGPTTDGRVKPDLVAPTNVSNTTYGTFDGTSASAPHVAGAALLVKNRYPAYTPAQIQGYLESVAIELGAAGKDNIFGSGRLYLPTPAPTPTPTPINPLLGSGVPTSHGSSAPAPVSPAPPVSLPNILIQSASLSAKTVTSGTPVTVTADIINKSAVNGIKKVTLYVNGQVETTQGITVNRGGSTKLTLDVTRSEPGDYTVYVDGVQAGRFKVEMFRESDGILIFSAVLVGLAFILGMVMLWRRQQRAG